MTVKKRIRYELFLVFNFVIYNYFTSHMFDRGKLKNLLWIVYCNGPFVICGPLEAKNLLLGVINCDLKTLPMLPINKFDEYKISFF